MVQTVEKSAPFLQIKSWSKLIQGWINIKTRTKHEKIRKNTQKCLYILFYVIYYKRGDDNDAKAIAYIKGNESG